MIEVTQGIIGLRAMQIGGGWKYVNHMDGEWCGPLEPPHDQEAG
jgi:hypothetical protein